MKCKHEINAEQSVDTWFYCSICFYQLYLQIYDKLDFIVYEKLCVRVWRYFSCDTCLIQIQSKDIFNTLLIQFYIQLSDNILFLVYVSKVVFRAGTVRN